ncbi:hypothetical protein V1T75_13355 [Tenacibaculum sp. FZY0031]|uniref:hypothetical protein n=1 Tax=Tenacibaculum sp. FZY0031 TaxID=3116648 RepID=UPI002EC2B971|nr:hypothetical protein [Tenacibaculum sp. FZY0031]
MKKILFIALFITTTCFAQKPIHNYKYVIVPTKFDFVKGRDKYQISSLTKFLFNKYGFTAFLEDESLPADVVDNRCLALTGVVKDDSGMFITKNIVELRDCYNKVVFRSQMGKSKEKEYKKAYHEAIRNAFKSIRELQYKYTPSKDVDIVKSKEKVQLAPTVEVMEPKNIDLEEKKTSESTLYAQSIINGFQLVNIKPEVVYKVLETNVKNVFVIEDKNGILYKNGDSWYVECYKNGIKTTKKYQIKF